MDVTDDSNKVGCSKEQYRNLECLVHESRQIGSGQTGDARVTVNILGISELKWTGMAVGKNPLEEAEPST